MNNSTNKHTTPLKYSLLLATIITLMTLGFSTEEPYGKPGDPLPPSVTCNCYNPPFITNQSKPNVLIILDNSNSMDEDFYGGAVGSFSTASKSEIARTVLRDLIAQTKGLIRLGIMTYKLPTDVQASYIHNSHYFASYDIRSWCPGNPPDACRLFCENHTRWSDKATCANYCTTQNQFFDIDSFVDQIVDTWNTGPYFPSSAERIKYCRLTYPKTQAQPNPLHDTDDNSTIYYKNSAPFYASSDQGAGFCYSPYPYYNAYENTPDIYDCYADKVGSSNFNTGYSNFLFSASFLPTDSDYALGYRDFGKRVNWYSVGQAWYSTSSTANGTGYLHTPVEDLSDANGTLTSTYTNGMTRLTLMDDNSTRYMSCSSTDKNTCGYIVNAALTPTAGTLKLAYDYFKGNITGTPSPIQSVCQKNFIIYVTDGLPNVDEQGVKASAESLMPTVLTRIDNLRTLTASVGGGTNRLGVKTYVLGMGLTSEAKIYLDQMADHGNTTISNHAYYGDDPAQFANALSDIFGNIVHTVTSATSVSILSEKTRQGANLIQAVFYPTRALDTSGKKGTWLGHLYNYWMHISKTTTTLREDTVQDLILNLANDYVLEFSYNSLTGVVVDRYRDADGDGMIDANETASNHVDTVTLDETKPLWEAGKILSRRSAQDRTLYTVVNTPSSGAAAGPLIPFNDGNSSSFSSLLGSPLTYDACLGEDNNTRRSRVYPSCTDDSCVRRTNLINYVRGRDAIIRDSIVPVETGLSAQAARTTPGSSAILSIPHPRMSLITSFAMSLRQGLMPPPVPRTGTALKASCARRRRASFSPGPTTACSTLSRRALLTTCPIPECRPPVAAGSHRFRQGTVGLHSQEFSALSSLAGSSRLLPSRLRGSQPLHRQHDHPRGNQKGPHRRDAAWRCSGAGHGLRAAPPSDTCPSVSCSNVTTCYNPGGCTGLSSYFALDITDPEQPKFLWEFAHPNLGYSYSGPAVLTRNGKYYVMFLSGPTGLDGSSNQDLHAFTLTINPRNSSDTRDPKLGIDMIESIDVWTSGSNIKNAIGGRLFTTGVDINGDGNTDFVFFGESDTPSGKLSGLKGGVIRVYLDHDDPGNWDFTEGFLNLAQQPITAKVETAKCFNRWYLFLGSGRYFTASDAYPTQRDFITAVPLYCTDFSDPSTCPSSINYVHGSEESVCTDFSAVTKTHQAWFIELDGADGSDYLKERLITDPTVSSQDMVFFTTTQPVGPAKACETGGHTRVWAMNCATGEAINDYSCAAAQVKDLSGTIYLQTSTGAINRILVADSFTDEGGRATPWIEGIPPESSTPFVGRFRTRDAHVLHWIEK